MSTLPNGDHGIIDRAVDALAAFGDDLDRVTAERLLTTWKFSPELTGRDRDQILDRFPALCAHCWDPIELAVPAPPGPRVWTRSAPGPHRDRRPRAATLPPVALPVRFPVDVRGVARRTRPAFT